MLPIFRTSATRLPVRYFPRKYSQIAKQLEETPVPVQIPKKPPKKKSTKAGLQSLRWPHQKQSGGNKGESSIAHALQRSDLTIHIQPVTSVTIGETIDLDRVKEKLGQYAKLYDTIVPDEVIRYAGENPGESVMVLANGTLVGWGIAEDDMGAHVTMVSDSVVTAYSPESEEMDFVELGENDMGDENHSESFVLGDIFVAQNRDPQQKKLEMAAFAIGLSRSTRLSILEESLERHIALTRENSEFLSRGLEVNTKEADILKLTGRLFLLRGKLNLYSELIETPDLYWSEPNLEKIYDAVGKRLDILLRILIMNRKLDYVTEEQRALLTVLNEKKSTRLEWIIIILIMVEVGFETFHFVERYWESREDHVRCA